MRTKKVKGPDGKTHLELIEGSCVVKIYSGTQSKNGSDYPINYVTYFEGGERIRKSFSDAKVALTHAETTLARLANGETAAKDLRPVDLQEAVMARAELEGLNVGLLTAAKEYRSAMEQLAGKGTLNDAVRYFLTNANPDLPAKTVAEICIELIAAKTADKLSKRYLEDLRTRVEKFAGDHKQNISEIKTADIEKWLRGLGTGAKNRNNYAGAITTLFKFAKRAGYLPEDRITAADNLSRAKDSGTDIEIYSVNELKCILDRLQKFRPELVPFVALGAFTGIRTAEILRLTWEDIDFETMLVQVRAKNAKTAQRRLIPMQPNLAAWLAPHKKSTGQVCSLVRIQHTIRKFTVKPLKHSNGKEEKGVAWKPNALRHSYGSYRLPVLKSAAELALEMGNSPAMIFRHYREIVKPNDAKAYWEIAPKS